MDISTKLKSKIEKVFESAIRRTELFLGYKITVVSTEEFSQSIDIEFVVEGARGHDGKPLPKRSVKITDSFRQGLDVSHGRVSPRNITADLVQEILVGEISKILLEKNGQFYGE